MSVLSQFLLLWLLHVLYKLHKSRGQVGGRQSPSISTLHLRFRRPCITVYLCLYGPRSIILFRLRIRIAFRAPKRPSHPLLAPSGEPWTLHRRLRSSFVIMPLNASAIYPATDPSFISFPSRRSVVHSTKGIVSSTQPLATQTGIRILREGGNAAVSRPSTRR